MRKRPTLRTWVTTSALAVTFTGAQAVCGSETPLSLSPELSSFSNENTPLSASPEASIVAAEREVEMRRIVEMQRVMQRSEADLTRAVTSIRWEKPMRKFEGHGKFRAADLMLLSVEFEHEFHRPMPVTARGETATHLRLGLDHRGKFDVGVGPETPEGIWLRRTLEARQISYIAFRRAVRGSATAPHIHIGTASTRIPMGLRAAFRMAFYRHHEPAQQNLSASIHRFHAYHVSAKSPTIVVATTNYRVAHRRRTQPFKSNHELAVAVQKPVAASALVLSMISPVVH